MQMHKSITLKRVMNAAHLYNISLDNPGFCIACGKEQDGCEPDATEIECESCGEAKVHGAQELLFHMA